MSDSKKPLPGPSDEVIIKEITRHMALCGTDFPDCGIGHAMRYIFAQEANRRPESPKMPEGAVRACTCQGGEEHREGCHQLSDLRRNAAYRALQAKLAASESYLNDRLAALKEQTEYSSDLRAKLANEKNVSTVAISNWNDMRIRAEDAESKLREQEKALKKAKVIVTWVLELYAKKMDGHHTLALRIFLNELLHPSYAPAAPKLCLDPDHHEVRPCDCPAPSPEVKS